MISKGGKEARLKEEGGGGGRGGQKGWPYRRLPPPADTRSYGTLPWASREGRTGTRPYQKPDQNRTRIRVLCQEEVISLQSSAQAEALRPASRTGGLEKREGWEGLRRGQREGRGEWSIQFLVPHWSGHSGQLSVSGGDQGQEGTGCGRWVWSIGRQAGP